MSNEPTVLDRAAEGDERMYLMDASYHAGVHRTLYLLGIDPAMPLSALQARLALTDADLAILERVRGCSIYDDGIVQWDDDVCASATRLLRYLLGGER